MSNLDNINFKNSFGALSKEFYTKQNWSPLPKAKLVNFNNDLAEELGLMNIDPKDLVKIFNGEISLENTDPLAMVYAGHQFGNWVPQLGDGRGILFGQIETSSGLKDLHIKGAGKTPYSRFGDGRAVLRSSIREYLCGEAMHGLKIPSSRSLIIFTGEEPVFRETTEPGAMMVRSASTHIRFGNFEYLCHNDKKELLPELITHVIEEYFSEYNDLENKFELFFESVVRKTAELIAHWQTVGFAHGVMNTDNMSILGETFDFGPFGFLENYQPDYICNHSDYQGRYAFNNQPNIGLWNCQALAAALSPIIEETALKKALENYQIYFYNHFIQLFRKKLGLLKKESKDFELIEEILDWLMKEKIDYTNFFRNFSDFIHGDDLFSWKEKFLNRLELEKISRNQHDDLVKANNPKFILRNYLAQVAIEKAENDDFSEVDNLLKILKDPFSEHKDFEDYANESPEWGKNLEISCSS